ILPLLILAIWSFRVLRSRMRTNVAARSNTPIEGADSEFYQIERLLERSGFARDSAESMQAWIQRLEITGLGKINTESLLALLSLHYRYRFDPHGLRTQDRARLKFLSESWIAQHSHLPRASR